MSQPDTGHLCRDCIYSRPDDVGGTWCHSPQVKAITGNRSIRAIFERDSFAEPERQHSKGTGKCGQMAVNFQRREFV